MTVWHLGGLKLLMSKLKLPSILTPVKKDLKKSMGIEFGFYQS